MQLFLNLVESQNVVALLLIAGIVYAFGKSLVSQQPRSRAWGFRCAFFMMFWYCIATGRELAVFDASTFLPVFLRGLIAATLVLGGSWIVFSAIGPILSKMKGGVRSARWGLSSWLQRRPKPLAAERGTLEIDSDEIIRQRAQQVEEAARIEAEVERKQAARLSCDLTYERFAAECGPRFPREQYEAMVERYLTSDLSVEIYKTNAQQICDLIRDQAARVDPASKFDSMEDLERWFSDNTDRVERLDISEHLKADTLTRLNIRYSDMARKLLEGR